MASNYRAKQYSTSRGVTRYRVLEWDGEDGIWLINADILRMEDVSKYMMYVLQLASMELIDADGKVIGKVLPPEHNPGYGGRGRRKLTDEQVRYVRSMKGKTPQSSLAKIVGITQCQVSAIQRWSVYRNVKSEEEHQQ